MIYVYVTGWCDPDVAGQSAGPCSHYVSAIGQPRAYTYIYIYITSWYWGTGGPASRTKRKAPTTGRASLLTAWQARDACHVARSPPLGPLPASGQSVKPAFGDLTGVTVKYLLASLPRIYIYIQKYKTKTKNCVK